MCGQLSAIRYMAGKSRLVSRFRFGSLATTSTEKRTRLRSQALNYPVENHARKTFKIESEFCIAERTVSNVYIQHNWRNQMRKKNC